MAYFYFNIAINYHDIIEVFFVQKVEMLKNLSVRVTIFFYKIIMKVESVKTTVPRGLKAPLDIQFFH